MSRPKKDAAQGAGEAAAPRAPRARKPKREPREARGENPARANLEMESSQSERLTMQLRRQLAPGASGAQDEAPPSPEASPPAPAASPSAEAVPEPRVASDEPIQELMTRYSRSRPRLPKTS